MERLLDTRELAELLNVPASTVETWRSRRKGPPSVRVGRYVRYRESDVEEWLDGQTQGGLAA